MDRDSPRGPWTLAFPFREATPRNARLRLLLLGLVVSCAEDSAAPRPAMQVELITGSLITGPGEARVLLEREEDPVIPAIVVPVGMSWFDGGSLPALRMPPPAEVEFDLPAGRPGARLSFAAGIDRDGYGEDQSGAVRFEVELRGEQVFETTHQVGEQTPRQERRWHRGSLDVSGGGRLVLRTVRTKGQDSPVPAAFGLLTIQHSLEVDRTRASTSRPNVLVILIDTLRADGLHSLGNPLPVSPVLDELATRGELFEQVYAPSPWTWPSTASLLTGQLPEEHGFVGPDACHLSDGLVTLAEAFQLAGLTTAAFVCNPLVSRSKNLQQGFETFEEYQWTPARQVEDRVIDWIDRQGHDRFFLYLHWIEPHSPNDPDEDFEQRFVSEDRRQPVLSRPELLRRLEQLATGEATRGPSLDRHIEHLRSYYDAEIRTVDRAVGRILRALEERGLLEDTLVAVTSDHGHEFLEHGQIDHGGQLFEETLRVPLLLVGPGVERGVRRRHRTELRHLGRTLLELAGVEPPPGNLRGEGRVHVPTDGAIFLSTATGLWFGPTGELERGPIHGVLQGHLLLHWCPASDAGGAGWCRLYDLHSDPEARVDIAHERPREVTQLLQGLEQHLERSASRRPRVVGGGRSVREELQGHGYLGGDEDE